MKSVLFEYYKPNEQEIKEAWDTGVFTFDANVLLNFYRYSNKTTTELFNKLEYLKTDLWLTHQAGYEFFKNRNSVIFNQRQAYSKISDMIKQKLVDIDKELNFYKKHSTIEVNKISSNINAAFDPVLKDIEGLKEKHPNFETADSILERLTLLFDDRTGIAYNEQKLEEIFKEGERRYEKEIPPGFMDKKSKKDQPKQNLYGDLILWQQVIDLGKEKKKPVILVTDDLKEDWWDKFNGENQGPRKELLREFFNKTSQKIYIYQADKFLEYANRLGIGNPIEETAISEVREFRIEDEKVIEEYNKRVGAYASYLQAAAEATQSALKENPFINSPYRFDPKQVDALKERFKIIDRQKFVADVLKDVDAAFLRKTIDELYGNNKGPQNETSSSSGADGGPSESPESNR